MNLKKEVKRILRQRKNRIQNSNRLFKSVKNKEAKRKKETEQIENILDLLD